MANMLPTGTGFTIPAPVEGWDAISSLADMRPARAVTLENFYPEPGQIRLRKGFSSHATGMSGSVDSLMTWNGPSSSKMFAANGANIYEVTSAGAVGAAAVASLSSDRWQHVNMGTGSGNFLVICNGADDVRNYNGSAWATTPAITGVTPSTLVNLMVFKQRLFFIENNSLKFWYLGTAAIGGSASSYDLSTVCKRGGYLMACGSLSIDAGDGLDDIAAFVTSEGEVVIYQGSDPSSGTTWSLVGVYQIGRPTGRRCLAKLGGDLAVITEEGVLPLAQAIRQRREDQQALALSRNIQNAFVSAAQMYQSNFGWQGIGYPRGGFMLFNVPKVENSSADQYVVNSQTGAWCKFTGMAANAWELLNGRLYFAANDGTVYLADDGYSDNGADREGNVKTAFNYFNSRGRFKQFKMARALIASDAEIAPSLGLDTDFGDRYPTGLPSPASATGPFWDEEFWDDPYWGGSSDVQLKWTSLRGNGMCAAIRLRVSSDAADITVSAFDVIHELGGII